MLGRRAKDKITGFTGTITGRAEYISGCSQLLLCPPLDKDGKSQSSQWFDEQRLELLDGEPITLDNERTPGPDMAAPIR